MRNMILAILRSFALFRVRSLEIRLHDQNHAMQTVLDNDVLLAISAARNITRRDLAKARADYTALLEPGHRIIWGTA